MCDNTLAQKARTTYNKAPGGTRAGLKAVEAKYGKRGVKAFKKAYSFK